MALIVCFGGFIVHEHRIFWETHIMVTPYLLSLKREYRKDSLVAMQDSCLRSGITFHPVSHCFLPSPDRPRQCYLEHIYRKLQCGFNITRLLLAINLNGFSIFIVHHYFSITIAPSLLLHHYCPTLAILPMIEIGVPLFRSSLQLWNQVKYLCFFCLQPISVLSFFYCDIICFESSSFHFLY